MTDLTEFAQDTLKTNLDNRTAPPLLHFLSDPFEGLERERLVRLVLKISDAAAHVVVAHETEKGDDRAVGSERLARGDRLCERLERERCAADRQQRRVHLSSIRDDRVCQK